MISKMKELIAMGENINSISDDVKVVSRNISDHSRAIASFRAEIELLTGNVRSNADEAGRFCSSVQEQIEELRKVREDLKQEVYDFKLIKADIKSRLIAELTDDFRSEIRKESAKLETDIKRFNELKDELSALVKKFRSVESEIVKFKRIAEEVNAADFELSRHAKEISRADHEKLQLMQKVDQLERLVSKMRRGNR